VKKVISKDGTAIAFDQSGQGPALILVAPAFATRGDETSLVAALAPDFTVFNYDRRGRGDSGDTPPYAVEREVEDLDAVIGAAGGSTFVFGRSSGAVLALDAARALPTKITKLALYEPPFIVDGSHALPPQDFAAHLQELVASGQRGDAVDYWNTVIGMPDEMIAAMRQAPWRSGQEAVAHTLPYDAAITADTQRGDPSPLKQWASVTIPTLVLDGTVMMGRADLHTFMRHGAEAIANVLPHPERRILDGQDHGPADDVLAAALKAFFLG
jgi:pimeloyl-ACP methyl ester carboxylesterase